MVSLFFRNLIFTILQPGLIAGLIPYFLIRSNLTNSFYDSWKIQQYAGAVIAVSGFF